MKLIWLSVAPWAPTGYGLVTRELVPRIINEGHEVTVACKHFHTGTVEWNGIKTIQGLDIGILNRLIEKGEYDYIISLLDNHALPDIPKRWISYTPFDTQKIPHSIAKWLDYPMLLIALTRHGQSEIERLGYDCLYAPHGVDTNIYCPDEVNRQRGREKLGWQDNFIIGTVGVNYPDDRKNYVNLFKAFKLFYDKHSEARLFMSTSPSDTNGDDYLPKCMENLGLKDLIKWTSPDEYFMGRVGDKMMANRYRLMDVFCMPTKGEGFGLPLLEAQACGVPVITTGASTGPELCPDQYLIPIKEEEWEWFNKEWRPGVNSQSIYEALELAYDDTHRSRKAEAGIKQASNYNWDLIFEQYWKPVLKEIEGLKTKVQTIPNYRKLYEKFDGRITMGDCGKWCKIDCPAIPGCLCREKDTERPIYSRSYPVAPNREGKLLVDTKCPLHKWLSKKFKKEVKEVWEYLWGFPEVRDCFINLDGYITLDDIKQDFNDEYKWAMQSQYQTNCPDFSNYLKGKVLEVGCGDGKRVKQFREQGLDVIGIEVNPSHIDSKLILDGDAEKLPFADNSFDVIYSVDVLEHLSEPLQAIRECFRVAPLLISSITPVEDKSFWEDPTHKVEWDRERWKREINEFGEIIDVLEPFTIIAKRRE